jgi:DNA repair exonuclease SbcCD ATPase subunit
MKKIELLRQKLEQRKGQRIATEQILQSLKADLKEKTRSLHRHEEAKEIIRTVGQKTQEQLSFHISDITTLALEAVFKDPYELKVDFVQRRNKTECDLLFTRDGMEVKPLDSSGGGAVDVAAFALRIASWSMMNPRTRNTIVLDEPLRFLSGDNQERASSMIKELSKRLGIQFIIVTHESILASYADRVFESTIRKGVTKIIQS